MTMDSYDQSLTKEIVTFVSQSFVREQVYGDANIIKTHQDSFTSSTEGPFAFA